MDRRVTKPKRVTSPTWGPPPPCKQALNLLFFFDTSLPSPLSDLKCEDQNEKLLPSYLPSSSEDTCLHVLALTDAASFWSRVCFDF